MYETRRVNPATGWRVSRPVIAATALVVAVVAIWAARGELGLTGEAEATTGAAVPSTHGISGHGTAVDSDYSVSQKQATSSGPISELDKKLLVAVRQADLWELPAGRLAQDNASSEQVKRAGLHLMEGHSRLDQMVREIAAALNVAIPNEATPEQQGFVQRLQNSRGAEFDAFFANILRETHGKVYVIIAQVRATTQNSLVRDMAIEANKAVSDHQEVLEDTGLVDASTFEKVELAVVKP
jgi:predicted outer membrane protein